jgi:cysteinyl-tRNA synthetase
MRLSVTNTLTGEQEPFETEDDVLLYVCGLTVSDDAHLGHARLWMHADFLHRWLAYEGYEVRHVENVTDVNEKIAARAGEPGLGPDEPAVARTFLSSILSDMRGLNLRRASVYPRVSEHLPEIIDLVQTLVERGYAYESNGSVYFDVTSFDGYGSLSNQRLEELDPQGPSDERAEKRHPADFALWKADGVSESAVAEHRHGELPEDPPTGETWASPWGAGRPGWHVECSAMSMTHLGETLDIHMGGRDLVFPHHENEIAQSEAATDEEFVRYWLHVGMLRQEGEKMSSSRGNFVTVSEALAEWGVNVVRMFYAGAAYRTDQTLSEDAMTEAADRWDRLSRAYSRAADACHGVDAQASVTHTEIRNAVTDTREAFETAMADDLNVREASTALLDLARVVNRYTDDHSSYDYVGLRRAVEAFEELGGEVLGLQFEDTSPGDAVIAEELVELLLEVREHERAAGNYDRADALRADLEALGVTVEDTDDGPRFRR